MKCKPEGNLLVFTFKDLAPITFDAAKAEQHAERAKMHGFEQRIRDNAAIAKSEKNNFTVTEQMRRDAVLEMVTHLESGGVEWNMKAGARAPVLNQIWAQLAAKRGVTYEAVAAEKIAADMAELAAE